MLELNIVSKLISISYFETVSALISTHLHNNIQSQTLLYGQ